MKYIRLDGTEFDGPLFHPQMEHAVLDDYKVYQTVFEDGKPIYRIEQPARWTRFTEGD